MKKILCVFVALFGWVSHTMGADGISAVDVTIPKGGSAVLEVQLVSEVKKYGGFQFDLRLPEGLSATKVEKAERLTAINDFTLGISLTDAEKNIYTVLGYNIDRVEIAGTSGAVAYITLQADGGVASGAVLEAIIESVVLGTIEAENIDAANSSVFITIDERRILFDETSTSYPAAETGVDVLVKRTIHANEWSTICLPFAMTRVQMETAFGEDVLLKDFTSYDVEYDASDNVTSLTVNFSDASAIEANHPYIIKVSSEVKTFKVDGVDIVPDEANAKVEYDNGKQGKQRMVWGSFYGTLKAGTVLEDDCLFLNGNDLHYSDGSTVIKGFRGYIYLVDILTDKSGIVHISTVLSGDANVDGKVNITDAVAVVDYILGNAPEGFNKDAADVNKDGNVNIMDAVGIVDIILNAKE